MKKSKTKSQYNKFVRAETVIPIVVIVGLIVIFAIIYTGPKDIATAEQVWDAIIDAGYQPVDATELYADDMPNLVQCIGFEKDDEYFNFYFFQDKGAARALYGQIHSHLYINFYSSPCIEHNSYQANYHIYTLAASGRYSVDIYVGNTVVYAYCDDEKGHNEGIVNVLKTIGYLD